MAWTYNEPWRKQLFYPAHIFLNFCGRAANQQFLGVNASHERNPTFEVGRKRFSVHEGRFGLNRMQTIHFCPDQAADHFVNRAAGMQDYLVAMMMGLFDELAEPGHNELIKKLLGQLGPWL